jgi:hypothetical protein
LETDSGREKDTIEKTLVRRLKKAMKIKGGRGRKLVE